MKDAPIAGVAGAAGVRGIASDARSLDRLRRDAAQSPEKALAGAAKQFEAVFMQMLMKSMREAMPKSELMDNEGSRLYTGMLDSELAQRLGERGLGLADLIVKQLSRQVAAPKVEKAGVERLRTATAEAAYTKTGAQGFVDDMLPHAREAERATGIPARFILGQAALESGWGKREIRAPDGRTSHNLFGIKAGAGWTGATVDVLTTEYVNGAPRKVVEKFRAYGSYRESFADYARLLASNPRYADVVARGQDAQAFAAGLQRAGYATDPAYAEKLTRVINHTITLARST